MKTIDELSSFDKPREKLIKKGVESLKDYELLAIVLGSGTKDKDVLKLSREIVKLFEDNFENISLEKLTAIQGLIASTKKKVTISINSSLTLMYWHIGFKINNEILKNSRAEYGKELVSSLSRVLSWTHFRKLICMEDALKRREN